MTLAQVGRLAAIGAAAVTVATAVGGYLISQERRTATIEADVRAIRSDVADIKRTVNDIAPRPSLSRPAAGIARR